MGRLFIHLLPGANRISTFADMRLDILCYVYFLLYVILIIVILIAVWLLYAKLIFVFFRLTLYRELFSSVTYRELTTEKTNWVVKVFLYSLPSIGPGADPGSQRVSPQVTWSESRHRPGSRSITICQACGYLRSFHQMALPVNGSTHLIPAYYSFIDPERMKGWVGLDGWPVADGLLTLVVTYQLQVECMTGKVRESETDVLPLYHNTIQYQMLF